MHALAQQLAQRLVDQPVPRDPRLAGETRGDDIHREVALAARVVPGMAGMFRAVVDHGEPFGVQGSTQPRFDLGRYRPGFQGVHRAYIAGLAREGRLADDARNPRFHGRIGEGNPCSVAGCDQPGEFRAPAHAGARPSFDGPGDWRWLCLDHVRAFNQTYNYFTGMSADEIAAEQRPYAGWERETRAFAGADRPPRWADFVDPLEAIQGRFGKAAAPQAERADGKPLSGADRTAMGVLGLTTDADRRQLRQRYSDLVRRYHPDRNGGDRRHERELQRVIEAYKALKASPAFA